MYCVNGSLGKRLGCIKNMRKRWKNWLVPRLARPMKRKTPYRTGTGINLSTGRANREIRTKA